MITVKLEEVENSRNQKLGLNEGDILEGKYINVIYNGSFQTIFISYIHRNVSVFEKTRR